ncbi:MAG: hypothetical protein A3C35_06575 [Omnitrophica bacterium RIFCSPHIGHO2_02_FULL_46_11]|nr:MAG: hypothetical protein A3A81_05305 [Omnitrophica bacterium RIFCSPLOWO2_01_FULL_45_10b]OGW87728.1 MAG: hypothetical protein A3C35_06575 [Omnitrophica bacterium RIFCSPHIGHO2_02_FULL_46_11]
MIPPHLSQHTAKAVIASVHPAERRIPASPAGRRRLGWRKAKQSDTLCHPEQSEGSKTRDSSPSAKQPFRVGLRMTESGLLRPAAFGGSPRNDGGRE